MTMTLKSAGIITICVVLVAVSKRVFMRASDDLLLAFVSSLLSTLALYLAYHAKEWQ